MHRNLCSVMSSSYVLAGLICSVALLVNIKRVTTCPVNEKVYDHEEPTLYSCGQAEVGINVINPSLQYSKIPDPNQKVRVYCDNVTEINWVNEWNRIHLVVLRRSGGSLDFNRTMEEYINGFGDLTGEFWIGLKTFLGYTQPDHYDETRYLLLLKLEKLSGEIEYHTYDNYIPYFEYDKYRLKAQTIPGDKLGWGNRHYRKAFPAFGAYDTDEVKYCRRDQAGGGWYIKGKCMDPGVFGKFDKNGHLFIVDEYYKSVELLAYVMCCD